MKKRNLIKSEDFQRDATQALADTVIDYFKVYEVFDSNHNKLETFDEKADTIDYAKAQDQ